MQAAGHAATNGACLIKEQKRHCRAAGCCLWKGM